MIILGIDGMDEKILKTGFFPNLAQKTNGQIDVSGFSKTHTDAIVTTHVTGDKNFGERVGEQIRENRDCLHLPDLYDKTFFNDIDNSHMISYPVKKPGKDSLKKYLNTGNINQLNDKVIHEVGYSYHHVRNTIEKMEETKTPRLIWTWFTFPDDIQHCRFGDLTYMIKQYQIIDKFVGDIKKEIEDDELVLIWSDHGFNPYGLYGKHSKTGCWSANKEIGLDKKTNHVAFHNFIRDYADNEQRSEVKKRMEALGYF